MNRSQVGPAPNLGWPQRLEQALRERSEAFKVHYRAVEWTTSELWHQLVLRNTKVEQWKHYSAPV